MPASDAHDAGRSSASTKVIVAHTHGEEDPDGDGVDRTAHTRRATFERLVAHTSSRLVDVGAVRAALIGQASYQREARNVVRDWLSQTPGQLTCPAAHRQECFLDVTTWRALLESTGFTVLSPHAQLLDYAGECDRARIAVGGWYIETSRYPASVPITLLRADPGA